MTYCLSTTSMRFVFFPLATGSTVKWQIESIFSVFLLLFDGRWRRQNTKPMEILPPAHGKSDRKGFLFQLDM